jgi:hypothetical protein
MTVMRERRKSAKVAQLLLLFVRYLLKGGSFMLESKFQANLIKKLKKLFPDCVVMKNDSSYIQGIPDLLVLYKDKWASLECKKNATAKHQPNQDYYVEKMDDMSFCKFIFPENEEEVLNELKHRFENG